MQENEKVEEIQEILKEIETDHKILQSLIDKENRKIKRFRRFQKKVKYQISLYEDILDICSDRKETNLQEKLKNFSVLDIPDEVNHSEIQVRDRLQFKTDPVKSLRSEIKHMKNDIIHQNNIHFEKNFEMIENLLKNFTKKIEKKNLGNHENESFMVDSETLESIEGDSCLEGISSERKKVEQELKKFKKLHIEIKNLKKSTNFKIEKKTTFLKNFEIYIKKIDKILKKYQLHQLPDLNYKKYRNVSINVNLLPKTPNFELFDIDELEIKKKVEDSNLKDFFNQTNLTCSAFKSNLSYLTFQSGRGYSIFKQGNLLHFSYPSNCKNFFLFLNEFKAFTLMWFTQKIFFI